MLLLANTCITLFGLLFVARYFHSLLNIPGYFLFIAITQIWLVALLIFVYLFIFSNRKASSFKFAILLPLKLLYTQLASALTIKILSGISYAGILAHDAFIYGSTGLILLLFYEGYLKNKFE